MWEGGGDAADVALAAESEAVEVAERMPSPAELCPVSDSSSSSCTHLAMPSSARAADALLAAAAGRACSASHPSMRRLHHLNTHTSTARHPSTVVRPAFIRLATFPPQLLFLAFFWRGVLDVVGSATSASCTSPQSSSRSSSSTTGRDAAIRGEHSYHRGGAGAGRAWPPRAAAAPATAAAADARAGERAAARSSHCVEERRQRRACCASEGLRAGGCRAAAAGGGGEAGPARTPPRLEGIDLIITVLSFIPC